MICLAGMCEGVACLNMGDQLHFCNKFNIFFVANAKLILALSDEQIRQRLDNGQMEEVF